MYPRYALTFLLTLAAWPQSIERKDPALDRLVPPAAQIEKVAGGFGFVEGPVWTRDGALLFSDIPKNTIFRWAPGAPATPFKQYEGTGSPENAFVGPNGLTFDKQGRLVVCEQIGRRLSRLEKDGKITVLAERFEGKHLNSPNDAVFKSDGSLYFTDPPYGLPKQDDDPKKELPFNGVYRLKGDTLEVLYKDLSRPNGIAFSPDEKRLYVANSDGKRKIWMRFDVQRDGKLADGSVFFDATSEKAPGGPDGMKVDRSGNLYCTGPGGVWVFSPDAKPLGVIKPPEVPANLHWGDKDGKTLYITARTGLYRVRMNVAGVRP